VPTDVGFAERRFEYDRSGNRVLESYFDEAGKPKKQGAGHFAMRNVYDECGQLAEEWYLDPSHNPIALEGSKYAGIRYVRDALGRAIMKAFLSTAGTPTMTAQGVAGSETDYDSRGNPVEERFFGIDKHPTLFNNSHAVARRVFDSRGNKTREEYLGLDGKPAYNIQVRLMTRSYNARNQLVEIRWSYFQVGTDTLLGVEKDSYNELSQKTDEAYFGPDGKPFLRQTNSGDCVRVHFVYDAKGAVSERQCFDERGERRKSK